MPKGPKHLFVTGFARSGTTLLANLLAAQPRFTIVGESHAAPLGAAQEAGGFHVPLSARDRNRALSWHKLWIEGKPTASRIGPDDFRTAGELYRLALDEIARPDDLVVGHKVTGYGPHTPVFRQVLDELDVRCVCVVRDVRDVVLSQSHRMVGRTIEPRTWTVASHTLRELRGHPRLAIVRYEDLVRDPVHALAPVSAVLATPLTTEVGALAHHDQPWRDNSSFHDVTRLFDARPVERWREHTADPVVRFAAWSCAEELARWNYPAFPEAFSWRERARFARATAVRAALHAARPLTDTLRHLRDP